MGPGVTYTPLKELDVLVEPNIPTIRQTITRNVLS
jgi:hypothetical protein